VKSATEEPLPGIQEVILILPLKENLRLIFKKRKLMVKKQKFVPNVFAQ